MQKSTIILTAAFATFVLTGCGDDDDRASEQMSAPAVSAPESTSSPAAGADTSGDAAGSQMQGETGADPSIPQASDVLQPADPANTAQETTDNPPNELTKQEESENMPQPGAVHSYSTTVREKTDQTSGQ